jgi:daunorubicin resistance ABC transporter ATP-binding subunit
MTDAPAIEAHQLVKTYGDTRALDGLSLQAPAGSILGVLGPNGAGKTTAVRVLTTLTEPESGTARVGGFDVVADAAEVRRHIGVTGQYAALDECLSGKQNMVMVGQLTGLAKRDAKRRASELLERFELTHAAGRVVKTYSGGMRRRLDLAASLVSRPDILFLDEPTTGLDPRSRNTMWDIIRELVADGTTLLLTTQYLEEADQLADTIVVVDRGTVIAEGTADDLKHQVGGQRLKITVPADADLALAAKVLERHADGPARLDHDDGTVDAPIRRDRGLVAAVVRELDDVGVDIEDVATQRPSLDDVFLTLTGHMAEDPPATTDDEREEAV